MRSWAIAGITVGVVAIAFALMAVLRGGSSGGETTQTASAPPATAPTAPAAPSEAVVTTPPAPGAPAPCEPGEPAFGQCFPADQVTGPEFLERIADKQGWDCYERGERDDVGNEITLGGDCQGANNVDQPYNIIGHVGYETHTFDDTGTMDEVRISASVGANLDKGQDVTNKHVDRALRDVFGIGTTHLWPDHEDWQDDARRAFKNAWRQCRSTKGSEAVERTPLGYEIACSFVGSGTVVVQGPNGQVKSITESVSIRAPMSPGLDDAVPPPPPDGDVPPPPPPSG